MWPSWETEKNNNKKKKKNEEPFSRDVTQAINPKSSIIKQKLKWFPVYSPNYPAFSWCGLIMQIFFFFFFFFLDYLPVVSPKFFKICSFRPDDIISLYNGVCRHFTHKSCFFSYLFFNHGFKHFHLW